MESDEAGMTLWRCPDGHVYMPAAAEVETTTVVSWVSAALVAAAIALGWWLFWSDL